MPFIPVNVNDAKEPKPVPTGKYNLTILNCEEVLTREKQKPQYAISIAIEGHDDAPNVRHYQSLPAEGDEPGASQFKVLLLRRLLTLFNVRVNGDGFDTTQLANDLIGATAKNAELTLDKPDDNGNVYNRLVLPRIKEESAAGAHRAAPPTAAKR